jgi:hypothetical protein
MTARLVIVTLCPGNPDSADAAFRYGQTLARVLADPAVSLMDATQLDGYMDPHRARSRSVRLARQMQASHVLWWDADVVPHDPGVVARMLESGHDLIGCVYPRKMVRWELMERAIAAGLPRPWERYAYSYPFRLHGQDDHLYGSAEGPGETVAPVVEGGSIAVDWLPMGFTLATRSCLDRMWDHYQDELWYSDVDLRTREIHDGVHLFGEMWTPSTPGPNGKAFRTPLSEDYAFCHRAAAMGIQPRMWVGEGGPVDHIGSHRYRGYREGLVNAR